MQTVFSHIGLNCVDLKITERFYERHFGFTRATEINIKGKRIVFLKADDILLELFLADGRPPASFDNDGPADPGFRHIAFQVDDIEAKLSEMGSEAKITLGPVDLSDWIKGWKVVWIRDPDGRIVEINQENKDED